MNQSQSKSRVCMRINLMLSKLLKKEGVGLKLKVCWLGMRMCIYLYADTAMLCLVENSDDMQ